jgi:hypothetical protein
MTAPVLPMGPREKLMREHELAHGYSKSKTDLDRVRLADALEEALAELDEALAELDEATADIELYGGSVRRYRASYHRLRAVLDEAG